MKSTFSDAGDPALFCRRQNEIFRGAISEAALWCCLTNTQREGEVNKAVGTDVWVSF